eukprot:m.28002 g.28002  ORF g.28002 m.28002 type:complete len:257 (-) comp13508_c0_seq1:337-1107(-)
MSVEYLRAYIHAIDDAPLDIQYGVSQLSQRDWEAGELLENIKLMITSLASPDAKSNDQKELWELCRKLMHVVQAQEETTTEMCTSISRTANELDKYRAEFESGAYLKRELLENAPPPSSAPSSTTASNSQRSKSSKKTKDSTSQKGPGASSSVSSKTGNSVSSSSGTSKHGSSGNSSKSQQAKKKRRTQSKKEKKPVERPQYCRPDCTVADGEMVGCDQSGCPHGEWFHLSCVGLKKSPGEDQKWYCPDCKRKRKR